MKVFLGKFIGVLVIALVLFSYQSQAHTLSLVNKALEEKQQEINELNASADRESEATGAHSYKDGVYSGKGTGYAGEMTVEVTVEGGKITKINITETSDDKAYLNQAEKVIDDMIDTQSTDVDTVTGATYSSNGIIDAVNDALTEKD